MESTVKEPHTISLKVLRLSRPQLATQDPLPEDLTTAISHQASLALPSASIDDIFTLTPLLTFPTSFGTAYVGESFSCILSLNNELPPTSSTNSSNQNDPSISSISSPEKRITSVRLAAEMQTPSQTRSLDFNPTLDSLVESGLAQPGEAGANVQSILTFDLREEGTHVLCVNISYTESMILRSAGIDETTINEGKLASPTTPTTTTTTGGRVRLLRKLYNFNVGPCLSVRTKATPISSPNTNTSNTNNTSTTTRVSTAPVPQTSSSSLTPHTSEKYLLECQLENLADDSITMERLIFEARSPFSSNSLNWDAEHVDVPVLAPREVTQVAFLVEEDQNDSGGDTNTKELTKDGRVVLGVLTIHWRSAMGCLGVLSTGWLASRVRK